MVGSSVAIDGVDADEEVTILAGQPAPDALGVAAGSLHGVLDRDPATTAVADLPAGPHVARHGGRRDVAQHRDAERTEHHLVEAAPTGQHEVRGRQVICSQGLGEVRCHALGARTGEGIQDRDQPSEAQDQECCRHDDGEAPHEDAARDLHGTRAPVRG